MLCLVCQLSLSVALHRAFDFKSSIDPDADRLLCVKFDNTELPGAGETEMFQQSLDKFREGSESGCFVCRLVWMHNSGRQNPGANETSVSRSSSSPFPASVAVNLYVENVVPRFYFLHKSPSFITFMVSSASARDSTELHRALGLDPAARSTCTSESVELWRHWYRTCTVAHSRCRQVEASLSPFTPARLIEILEPKSPGSDDLRWRVVLRTNTGHVPYVSLSHCWGSSPHTTLNKANLSGLLTGSFDCSMLPKTYKDALIIADSLGFRHIWIDSLCIIQDDEADWLSESTTMDKIYRHSACNIAATWADDGTKGCFSQRDPVVTNFAAITVSSSSNHGERKAYQLGRVRERENDIDDAPLNCRGWVVQERYLSRRQVQFAASQVYWECLELVASEQFPAGLPSDMCDEQNSKPNLEKSHERHLQGSWVDLVQRYSYGKLTKLADKAIAVSGLANHIRSKTGDQYLAGLWRKDLERQLGWSSDPDQLADSRIPSIGGSCVPSWSWMSVNSPVEYDFRYHMPRHAHVPLNSDSSYLPNDTDCVEVLDASIHSSHPSKLHSFSSGELLVKGVALWGRDTGVIRPPVVAVFGATMPGQVKVYQFRVDREPSSPSGAGSHAAFPDFAFNVDIPPLTVQEASQAEQYAGKDTEPDGMWNQATHACGDTDVVLVKWDTRRSSEWQTRTDLLFLMTFIHQRNGPNGPKMAYIRGLVLREREGPSGKGVYTREGLFYYNDNYLGEGYSPPLERLVGDLWERTTEEDRELSRITFDDPEIKKLVKVVTIV